MFKYEEQVREILKEFMDYPNEAPTRALIYDRLAEIVPDTEYTIICDDTNNEKITQPICAYLFPLKPLVRIFIDKNNVSIFEGF